MDDEPFSNDCSRTRSQNDTDPRRIDRHDGASSFAHSYDREMYKCVRERFYAIRSLPVRCVVSDELASPLNRFDEAMFLNYSIIRLLIFHFRATLFRV